MDYNISDARRFEYREMSQKSYQAKIKALAGKGPKPIHKINYPKLDPNTLMPRMKSNGFRTLSLFSGGGGLDLGFDRAGFKHIGSYEIIDIAGASLKRNRPNWNIYSGDNGDVRKVHWKIYKNKIDVIHGGPPCQPFSIAGQRKGKLDKRDMWPEFTRAIIEVKPKAFVAENVTGLLSKKFENYVNKVILETLSDYIIKKFLITTSDFGVPQKRTRVIFIGFKNKENADLFTPPEPTHFYKKLSKQEDFFNTNLKKLMGAREALGLTEIDYDGITPTIRSAFTGKRNTTSVLNSTASQKNWRELGLWPNGVQLNRERARNFITKDKTFRMSVQDIALLQGFPSDWVFEGAVYQILGQIGNSVSPIVAYNIAIALKKALV